MPEGNWLEPGRYATVRLEVPEAGLPSSQKEVPPVTATSRRTISSAPSSEQAAAAGSRAVMEMGTVPLSLEKGQRRYFPGRWERIYAARGRMASTKDVDFPPHLRGPAGGRHRKSPWCRVSPAPAGAGAQDRIPGVLAGHWVKRRGTSCLSVGGRRRRKARQISCASGPEPWASRTDGCIRGPACT